MIEVHFYNENSKNEVFFKKMMESPPRVGEEMEVLGDPSNITIRGRYSVIHVKTTIAIFDTPWSEIRSVILKEVDANQSQVAATPPQ